MQWTFEFGSYYLKDDNEIISMCDEIGLCYSEGEIWTIHKHGRPAKIKKYCDIINKKLEDSGLLYDYPDMEHKFITLKPIGDQLDEFNHALQCTGYIQKFLTKVYCKTIDAQTE